MTTMTKPLLTRPAAALTDAVRPLSANLETHARATGPRGIGPDTHSTHRDGDVTVVAHPTREYTWFYVWDAPRTGPDPLLTVVAKITEPDVHPVDIATLYARHGKAALTALGHVNRTPRTDSSASLTEAIATLDIAFDAAPPS